jgi:predicted DNA-binding transcriptional regulator
VLAARGINNQQIARALMLSEATVKRHLANVYIKMGVHSRIFLLHTPVNRSATQTSPPRPSRKRHQALGGEISSRSRGRNSLRSPSVKRTSTATYSSPP